MTDNLLGKCGCGKPARYSNHNNLSEGSCNKYSRCPTYEQLLASNNRLNQILYIYIQACNELDDYFEYRAERGRDKNKVIQILQNIVDDLERIKQER